jgi:hypothetical protein
MVDILRITAGGGDTETRRLLRERDWSTSPLGPPESWPPELATAVSMVLSSTFPMFVAWGPQLSFLYNDAYVPVLGNKHPAAFGEPFQQIWHEIWADVVPIVDRALSNKSAYFENLPLTMERKGYPEQTWFTFSYSPLHDGQGRVMGLYCTCIETTGRIHSERRAAFELALTDALRQIRSDEDLIGTASALLGQELAWSASCTAKSTTRATPSSCRATGSAMGRLTWPATPFPSTPSAPRSALPAAPARSSRSTTSGPTRAAPACSRPTCS